LRSTAICRSSASICARVAAIGVLACVSSKRLARPRAALDDADDVLLALQRRERDVALIERLREYDVRAHDRGLEHQARRARVRGGRLHVGERAFVF